MDLHEVKQAYDNNKTKKKEKKRRKSRLKSR